MSAIQTSERFCRIQKQLRPMLLHVRPARLKVIFLTLAGNQMVVHDRQRLVGVTVTDLLQALQMPGGENGVVL